MSDGSLPQPTQARLSATFGGAPPPSAARGASPSSTAGGTPSSAAGRAAAARAASLSAFTAVSASRTSLVPAPRSGCCSCSLASSGLRPRSGSATRSARTAERRFSDIRPAVQPLSPATGARGS
eukprot:scaffold73051_cov62-Phaeocystis_antarctica.AAC.2